MRKELDLQALRLLLLLEQHGSLAAAGRRLGISQPAASACLRAFESRWQLAIAKRSASGTKLTADGAAVAAWGRELLHQVDSVRSGLAALSAQRTHEQSDLGVAASLTIAEFVFPTWLGELLATVPDVHPRLQVVNSDAVDGLVRAGDCEIGFVETAEVPADLTSSIIGWDRLVLVVNARHPWARSSKPLTRDEILAVEFVVREEGSGTRQTFERALGEPPRIGMVATSTTAMIGAAVAGVGPAVVSPRAVAASVATGQLVVVNHELDLERPLSAIWQRERTLGLPAASLLRIARSSTARG